MSTDSRSSADPSTLVLYRRVSQADGVDVLVGELDPQQACQPAQILVLPNELKVVPS
jgi:hypothetical protein